MRVINIIAPACITTKYWLVGKRHQISDTDCRIGYLAESRLKRKAENKSRKQAEEDQDLRDREEEYIKTQPPQGKEVFISRLTGDIQNIHNKYS